MCTNRRVLEMGIQMSQPTILVVDDCHSVRLSVKRMLVEAGYEVIVACDGEEAIQQLGENPDLIVLDINMPGLDGFGFCERFSNESPELRHVPIVFLTTEESMALEMLGKELGAYLKKPVSDEDLLAVVQSQLEGVVA